LITDRDDKASVRKKLEVRFAFIPDTSEGLESPVSLSRIGRPPAEWHADAVQDIDDLVSGGLAISEAARRIAAAFGERVSGRQTVSGESMRDIYYSFKSWQREESEQAFYRALIDRQFDFAASLWFQLDAKQQLAVNTKFFSK